MQAIIIYNTTNYALSITTGGYTFSMDAGDSECHQIDLGKPMTIVYKDGANTSCNFTLTTSAGTIGGYPLGKCSNKTINIGNVTMQSGTCNTSVELDIY